MITHPSLPQRLVRQLLALSACALGMMASLVSAQTFTPGDVFWATSLAQPAPPVNNQIRIVKITAGGDYSAASTFAVLPDRVYGQIAFTNDRTGAYIASFFINRVLTLSPTGVVGDGSPGHPIFATGINRPTGLLVVRSGALAGHLLVSSFGADKVYDITAGGDFTGATAFASGTSSARALIQTSDGRILCATSTGVKNITTGATVSFATGIKAKGLIQTTDGKILCSTGTLDGTNTNGNTVFDITAGGSFSGATPFASGKAFFGLAIDNNGHILASEELTGNIYDITAGGNFAAASAYAFNLPGQSDLGLSQVPGDPLLVTTNGATGVTGTHATLNGTVNPGNLASSGYFEYGTSPTLATFSTTASVSIPSGGSGVAFSKLVSALTPFTTYYFRAVGTNVQFTVKGGILPFTTGSPNTPPTPMDDSVHPPAGFGAFTINVLANDTDIDLDPLTVVSVAGGTHGTPSVTAGGLSVTYTPGAGYTGNDTFTYTVSDGQGGMGSATVTLTNTAPIAVNDSLHPPAGFGAFTINVLANDSDPDTDGISVLSVGAAGFGTPSVTAGGGSVTYTPGAGYTGNDTFTYTIQDADGATATATVTLQNAAPIAMNDSVHPPSGTGAFTISVLGNDSDPDFDSISVLSVGTGTVGTPSVTAGGGSVTYTPGAGYAGNDTFTYTIQDAEGATATATVTLQNAAPVAMNDSVHPPAGLGAFPVSVLGNDSDPDFDSISVVSVGTGTVGTPSVTAGGGSATYAPGAGYAGNDSFSYTIDDGRGATATATVTLHNAAPVANDDHVLLTGSSVTVQVLTNDTDSDAGDSAAFAVSAVTNGTHGSVTNNTTDVTYTLTSPFTGEDTFTYTMTDGRGATATATVTVQTIVNICNFTGANVIGAPAGSTFKSFGVPSVVNGGIEAYKAAIVTPAGTRNVIVAGHPAAVVVTKGDPAPGLSGVFIGTFKDPVVNGLGNVAFATGLSGAVDSTNNLALITNLGGAHAIVARKGQQMPGSLVGNTLSSLTSVAITDTAVFFTAKLAIGPGGVTSANDFGLWVWHPGTGLEAVVIESDMVGGKQVKTITALSSVSNSQGQGRTTHGDLALVRLTFTDNKQAIYKMIAGTDLAVVSAGDTLTSGVAGAQWSKFGVPGLNVNGDLAFTGYLTSNVGGVVSANNIGIFAGANAASLALIARKGQTAPDAGGPTFASFKDALVNVESDVAFIAALGGSGLTSINKYGIWADDDDAGFHLVARGGDQPPGTVAGVQWASFSNVVLPDHLGPVFTAKLVLSAGLVDKTNAVGLWGRDGLGATYLLTRTGDTLTVNATARVISSIYALNAASGSPGQGRGYSHDGTIIYRVKFVVGGEAILCATLPVDM